MAGKGGAYIGQKTAVFRAVAWSPSQIKRYFAAEQLGVQAGAAAGAAAQPLEQLLQLEQESQQRWRRQHAWDNSGKEAATTAKANTTTFTIFIIKSSTDMKLRDNNTHTSRSLPGFQPIGSVPGGIRATGQRCYHLLPVSTWPLMIPA
ncbi:MAG TPA: hypothetical protein VMJ32_15925 [Pirellulales bacterium]|nr:hypothetical protein [Pirellulales bacterium]